MNNIVRGIKDLPVIYEDYGTIRDFYYTSPQFHPITQYPWTEGIEILDGELGIIALTLGDESLPILRVCIKDKP